MTKISLVFLAGCGLASAAPAASLYYDHSLPAVSFAAAEIHKVYATRGETLVEGGLQGVATNSGSTNSGSTPTFIIAGDRAESTRIATLLGLTPLKSDRAQSYAIRKHGATLVVLGADATGAMYGGLDLAEAVRLGSLPETSDSDHTPHIDRRGIKFNIPLDARTPSYSDNSDSAHRPYPSHRPPRHQVQHPPRRQNAELLR
jgi:hypothetical protein